MQKLLVATPAHGEIFYTPYLRSLLRLQRALIAREVGMSHMVVSFFETSEARNSCSRIGSTGLTLLTSCSLTRTWGSSRN